jgi:transcription elongation factor Elf1
MASLLFTCPTTRQQAPTGIGTDVQSLRAAWSKTLTIHCSLCGETHEISVRNTYIEGALDDAADRLRQVV